MTIKELEKFANDGNLSVEFDRQVWRVRGFIGKERKFYLSLENESLENLIEKVKLLNE